MPSLPQRLLDEALQDLRFTLRQIRKSPFFALTVIATFAIGIAANAAIFSVMDALVLHPLAVPDLNRVVTVASQRGLESPRRLSFPDFRDLRDASQSFTELAAHTNQRMVLTAEGASEHVRVTRATPNLFALYSIEPEAGRTFTPARNPDGIAEPGQNTEAVLTHSFWQTHFASRADVLNRTVVLDGTVYTVVGIMPRSFDHVDFADLWIPLALTPGQAADRTATDYAVTGRLAPHATPASAAQELNLLAANIARRFPQPGPTQSILVRPLVQTINGDLTPMFMRLILAAAVLLMLVVCANISNLQFARTVRRAPEMAMRCTLGSSRTRIFRQLLAESLVHSLIGVAAGLILAGAYLHLVIAFMPQEVSRFLAGWTDIHLSRSVLAYSVAVALAAGLLAGCAPALIAMRVNLLAHIKAGSRSATGSARSHRLRRLFAAAQITLATALVAGAALIAGSIYSVLRNTDRFAPAQTLTLNTLLPTTAYGTPSLQAHFLADARTRLAALPGVRSAEFTTALPYNNSYVWWQDLAILGDPALPGENRTAQRLTVSPGWLQSFSLPILQGRSLSPSDALDANPVAVINLRLAHRFFGNRNPIGQRIQLGRDRDITPPLTVVGVVADVVYTWTDQTPQPAVYLSSTQFPATSGIFTIRTEGDAKALAAPARQALAALDNRVPVNDVETYADFLYASLIGLSYVASMLAIDAAVALLLCALGIFGVMANLVTERTHEIGIRFAMGADRSAILNLMLRRSLPITAVGLAAGLCLAFGVTHVLGSILEGIHAFQTAVLATVTLAVGLISLTASYLPARRAAAVNPTLALHAE